MLGHLDVSFRRCSDPSTRPDSRRAPRDLSISGPMATTAKGPTSRNMRLLAQHPLNGFGKCGEGMAIQLTRDRRRVLWIAHESPPKNVTAVDVTDPRQPAGIAQTELPHDKMRSNSLDVVRNPLVVAHPTQTPGIRPAGVQIFGIQEPGKPPALACLDASGP